MKYLLHVFAWNLTCINVKWKKTIKKNEGRQLVSSLLRVTKGEVCCDLGLWSLADLDVARLFANDLEQLSQQERTCLDIIVNRAPADWCEIIELSSVAGVNQLVHKRMVIRSDDRLNIYWDIFKDNYTPTSDFFALMSLVRELKADEFTS